jgi:hypothetical protein
MGSKDNFEAADPEEVTDDRGFVTAGDWGVVPVPVHPAARTVRIQRTIRTRGPVPFRLLIWQTDSIIILGSTLPDIAILYRSGFEYFPVM